MPKWAESISGGIQDYLKLGNMGRCVRNWTEGREHHAPWEPVLSRKLLRLNKVFLDARNWRNLCRKICTHKVSESS